MGSRHGRVMVRRPFAPPRAWTLRSGAPPRGSVAGKEGYPGMWPDPGFQAGIPSRGGWSEPAGRPKVTVPRPAGGSRGCMGRHPAGKAAS